jgi:hypothetical protein
MDESYMKIHPDDWRQLLGDIEQLRKERDELLKQRFEVDEVEENARRRVETAFRSERDEARREVCELTLPCEGSQKGYAKGRGWNCYKEETQ